MRLITITPEEIILTNRIQNDCPYWRLLEHILQADIEPPPLIVFPAYYGKRRVFVVLDGNHRACKCAQHHKTIKAWVMRVDSDRDEILQLELEGRLPPFPHRDFLAEEKSLRELKQEAMQAAKRINCTIKQVLRLLDEADKE